MKTCSRPNCYVPDTGCAQGHMSPGTCPDWCVRTDASAESLEETDLALPPWSGSALGLVDLGFVAGRAKPVVIGVVGPQNAGKTTLLAAWYLLLARGLAAIKDRRFAGSYSLRGWEAIAASMRWSPGVAASFPPHTSSRSGRAPGLLHLAFRHASGRLVDYLVTDAPGEWFQKWAINRDSAEGIGAKWVAEHAEAFLLVADREALSGPNMGAARGSLQRLAQRLAAERLGRPVALVWTKADVVVPPDMEKAVRDVVLKLMPDAAEFSVSIVIDSTAGSDAGTGLVEVLRWTLNTKRARNVLAPLQATGADPLFLFGTRTR